MAVVTLPLALKKIIAVKFAGFRVPEDRDYALDWLDFHKNHEVPFLALDDFNHDGIPDVAMRLKHNQKDDVWKLVIFHGPDFAPFELESSPDPKAKMRNYGAIQGYGLSTTSDCSQPRCLASYRYESAASVFEWTGKGYRRRFIGN